MARKIALKRLENCYDWWIPLVLRWLSTWPTNRGLFLNCILRDGMKMTPDGCWMGPFMAFGLRHEFGVYCGQLRRWFWEEPAGHNTPQFSDGLRLRKNLIKSSEPHNFKSDGMLGAEQVAAHMTHIPSQIRPLCTIESHGDLRMSHRNLHFLNLDLCIRYWAIGSYQKGDWLVAQLVTLEEIPHQLS